VLGLALPEPASDPDLFEVWEENWQALEIFLKVQTQWRVGMGGLIGLDYSAVAWVLRLVAPEDQHLTLLDDLQTMERAVLSLIAKQES
jgi:hypothetical protein